MKNRLLPWLAGLAFIFVAILVVLGVYLSSQKGIRTPLVTAPTAFHIPAANAADAFHVYAVSSGASGMAVDSAIKIEAKVDVSAAELKQSLRIVPPVDVDLQDNGGGNFTLKPRENLEAGKIYKLSLATIVDDESSPSAREFSFALQTAPEFKLVSTIPGDHLSLYGESGVEFKFSTGGWGDPSSFVSVDPPTPGRWETHGRTLVFLPEKPFAPNTRFEFKIKKGFGPEGAKGLDEDIVLHVQTEMDYSGRPRDNAYLSLQPMFSAPVDKEWNMPVSGNVVRSFDAVFYRISKDDMRGLFQQQTGELPWTKTDLSDKKFESLAKNIAATTTAVWADNPNYGGSLHFPPLKPGYYLLNVKGQNRSDVHDWSMVQVTNNASYIVADKDQLYVWAVNAGSGRPISDLTVKIGSGSARTDASGLAKLATPPELAATSTNDRVGIVAEIGSGDSASFALLQRMNGWFYDRVRSASDRLWGYLYIDRPLYRTSDELHVFGLARDRGSDRGVGRVSLRLRRADIWTDIWTGEDKVYAQADIDTDSAGRFDGSLSWSDLPSGYYSVEAVQNGEIVSTQSIEVRQYAKPSYNLEMSLDKQAVYAGETATLTIRARFFDGTPVPRAKLLLSLDNGKASTPQAITLDADGLATVKWVAPTWVCAAPAVRDHYCQAERFFYADLRPGEGEQGDIYASTYLRVRSGNLGIEVTGIGKSGQGTASIRAYRQAFNAPEEGFRDNWAGRTLDVSVIPTWYEKVQSGYSYDPIEKVQKPVYTWQMRVDPVQAFRVTSDSQGRAEQVFPMVKGKNYEIVVDGMDDQGRQTRTTSWVWNGGDMYGGGSVTGKPLPQIKLDPVSAQNGYKLGTEITASLDDQGAPYQLAEGSGVLYFIGSRGLQEVKVESGITHRFRFERNLMTTAQVGAVIWTDGGFARLRTDLNFDHSDRELTLKAEPEKNAYAPGETIRVRVNVTDKSGAPVRDVSIAYGAVDKALLALTYDTQASPLESIYSAVGDGIIFELGTVLAQDSFAGGGGGAEMGGGGGFSAKNAVRKNFKDTAAFGKVSTDNGGQAVIEFKAPDNLTSWRFELVGISDALRAGSASINIPVSKPLFVTAVLPEQLLSSDKPVIKLRTYGTAVKNGEPVTYTVDAPTLGLTQAQASGTAGMATYVSVDKLVAGSHRFTIGVEQGNLDDAFETFINVADTRMNKSELVQAEAAPGSAIPDLGQSEASIIFTSKTKAALLDEYTQIADTDSARSDALIAKRMALRRLESDYGGRPAYAATDEELAARQGDFYQSAAGFRLLPNGSYDLEVSAEIAVTAPELLDRDGMITYFGYRYDDAKTSSLERIEALSGLAALGQPVLPELQAAASDTALDWKSQLFAARGLAAAGDDEHALVILNRLLEHSESRDNLTWLVLNKNDVNGYEATADAAALAARLHHPKAESLHNWVMANFDKDAFPILSRLRYLEAMLGTAVNRDVSLSYTFGDDEKTIKFDKDTVYQRLTLTRDEASRFRVTKVDGPVTISFIRTVAGRPSSVPELAILRLYKGDISNLHEGDSIQVTLIPEAHAKLQPGCYYVQDRLPAGLKPLLNWTFTPELSWYPVSVNGNTLGFMQCYDGYRPFEQMTYRAFVTSRGSFTAEAPSVYNMEYPSISAVGKDVQFTIK